MTNPDGNPANDPLGTVRVHHNRVIQNQPDCLRYIKTHDGWRLLTSHPTRKDVNRYDDVDMDEMEWPVQPLAEVARVLGHPESNADRCISCEHSLSDWHDATGCGYRIGQTRPNRTDTCTCGRAYPVPDPVEDIDTTQCEFAWDGGFRCALARGHEDPWHEDADGVRYHDDEQPPAAPSTVDTSTRERVVGALRPQLPGFAPLGYAFIADQVIAALPELVENERLHSEIDRLTYDNDDLRAQNLRAADAITRIAAQRDHFRAEIDRCRAAAERVDHEHRQELKTLRAAREEARARARRAEQRTHEAFSVGDHVTWTDDDGTTHTGIIERTDYRIERLYDALEILESNGYTYNYLLPSEVTKLPKQENQ